MVNLQDYADRVKTRPCRVVLPEGCDARVLSAAHQLRKMGIGPVTVLGSESEISAIAGREGIDIQGIACEDPRVSKASVPYASALAERNSRFDLKDAEAAVRSDNLMFAGMMVAEGDADAMIAGAANETGKVISAGLKTVGLAPGISRLSSYFLMLVPDFMRSGPRQFIFADCAVNIDPDAEQLADIAIASAASARKLLSEESRIAMLSFSTKGSARAPQVDKITEALELVRERAPDLAIDGELQADAAFVAAVAERKVKSGAGVAGAANVLVFPDLNSGNIGYKLVQYMANADAIGPFFQGFARPLCDLSRGCSVQDIVSATIIMLATAD